MPLLRSIKCRICRPAPSRRFIARIDGVSNGTICRRYSVAATTTMRKRWLALASLQLVPSVVAHHDINPFVHDGLHHPFLEWFSTEATQKPGENTGKISQNKNHAAVLQALENLVARLEEWEPNVSSPLSSQTCSSTETIASSTTEIHSSTRVTTAAETTKAWSIQENARLVCTGYNTLQPLQLGWVATNWASMGTNAGNWKEWGCPRSAILSFLARDCGVHGKFDNLQALLHGNTTNIQHLRQLLTPKFEDVFQCLQEQNSQNAIPFLVRLRGDLLRLLTVIPKNDSSLSALQLLEGHLRRLLSVWFSPGMLEIKRITFDTTAAGIIEKIATKEAVHPMKSLDDLRQRLGPKRRVFGLFHPLLPGEPLVILHVHLEQRPNTIPSSMSHVLTEDSSSDQTTTTSASLQLLEPRAATFYSISNAQPGLARGLGLGEFLIKEAVQQLQQEFPSSLESFVTLSPMPGFRKWLEGVVNTTSKVSSDDEHKQQLASQHDFCPETEELLVDSRELLEQLLQAKLFAGSEEQVCFDVEQQLQNLKPLLTKLAAHYLVKGKNPKSGKPLDPVAGFHIHNGAQIYRINYSADLSRKGWLRSLGLMTNYRYHLEQVESNKASFESSHFAYIPMTDQVRNLLR